MKEWIILLIFVLFGIRDQVATDPLHKKLKLKISPNLQTSFLRNK